MYNSTKDKSMILTEEQKLIIANKDQNMSIEARAGTGKTSTLIHYSLANNEKSKLYLAFNRSIITEAKLKFINEHKVRNMFISTIHSLARQTVITNQGYILDSFNLSVMSLGSKLDWDIKKHAKLIHSAVNKFNVFCDSAYSDIDKVDYTLYLKTEEAIDYYTNNKVPIDFYAKMIWNSMDKRIISVSHSFYLKKYQLLKPKLPYDIIMLDECQDANEVILDIFNNQKCIKIAVGDSHQSIYGWRGAINAMNLLPYKKFYLTKSFRFHQGIADTSVNILKIKNCIDHTIDLSDLKIIGVGNKDEVTMSNVKTKAILSRSNVGLLTYLIENIPFSHKYYIEGGVNSIYKTSSGFSIIDMYHLKENKNHLITNTVVNSFADYTDFIQYYVDVDDILVISLIDFLNSFTGDIVSSISYIENNIVSDLREADIVLSTIHKAKGKEWDYVKILGNTIEENFPHTLPKYKSEITRYKDNSIFRQFIEYISQDSDPLLSEEEIARIRANWLEEINLYYVGVTRAKKILEHNVFWMRGL